MLSLSEFVRKLKGTEKHGAPEKSGGAEAMLTNVGYQAARDAMYEGILKDWLGTEPQEVQKRDNLYVKARLLEQLEQELSVLIGQHKMNQ